MKFAGRSVVWRAMHPIVVMSIDLIDVVHIRIAGREGVLEVAKNGVHPPGSPFYEGRALGYRVYDLPGLVSEQLQASLAHELGGRWQVRIQAVASRPTLVCEYVPPRKDSEQWSASSTTVS